MTSPLMAAIVGKPIILDLSDFTDDVWSMLTLEDTMLPFAADHWYFNHGKPDHSDNVEVFKVNLQNNFQKTRFAETHRLSVRTYTKKDNVTHVRLTLKSNKTAELKEDT